MKKLLFSLALVAGLGFAANAQTEKGKIIVGGSVSFNSEKVGGATKADTEFSLIPTVGYFVSDNFAIGTGVGFASSKDISGTGTQNSAFVVAPYGRQYVNLNEQFKFFGQLSVPLAFGTVKNVDANGNVGAKLGSISAIGVNVAPGFAFFPNKKVGIELSVNGLSYTSEKIKPVGGGEVKSSGFGLEANTFAPKLGVQFHF